MKMKYRALTILLSIAMLLTFMPAMSFADGEVTANLTGGGSITVFQYYNDYFPTNDARISVNKGNDTIVYKYDDNEEKWIPEPLITGAPTVTTVISGGDVDILGDTITIDIYVKYDNSSEVLAGSITTNVIENPDIVTKVNGVYYLVDQSGKAVAWQNSYSKSATILDKVTIKGKEYGVYYLDGIGFYNYSRIPGFTIYGKTGSAAHKYASEYGFKFIDPAVEAEVAEWNGVLSSKIPAVKSVKAKAGKKKITVSWKKAAKKNLKKFDKVEIQVCQNKSFSKANTKRVTAKKSKKSATVKGLQKKRTYWVRVRDVKGTGTGKQVSKWSKPKKVKTK